MKKLTIFFAAVAMILGGQVAKAQGKYGADSAECIKYLSYYTEYYKQKNYDDAIPNWRKAYKLCPPTARQSIFTDGTSLVRRLIAKNAGNAEYKKALLDTLMALHNTRAQYYPKYAVTALNNKGTDIANYYKDDNSLMYRALNSVIENNKEETKPSILINNLNAAIELYQNGAIEAEDVINTYQRNIGLIEANKPANETEAEQNKQVKADMEGLFITSKVASCDNLISLFTPRFEAAPNDVTLATNIVKMMSNTDDCTNNDLYIKAVTSMHNNEPSAQSAYFLYRLNASRDNVADAMKYLKEAVAQSTDTQQQADYNYQLATYCVKNGRNGEAFSAAQKAASLDPSYQGKAYYLIGTIWGATSCGGDEITRRAPYWVACDYMQKAMAADPSLSGDCNRMIGQYSVYFPKAADAFMYDIVNGQSYTVNCGGMSATTTVRTQK